jgi:hypothetical protein
MKLGLATVRAETARGAMALLVLGAGTLAACSSATTASTGTSTSALGCPEFDGRTSFDSSVNVDVNVRAFMEAAATLKSAGSSMHGAVLTACAGIARDLGAKDSWSQHGDSDDAVSNSNHDGACDLAIVRIQAIMQASASAGFALETTPGECHEDFDAQAACEANCSAQTKCDPGTVVTRCDPAQLSVMCDASCKAQATCEGHADAACNCVGASDAHCDGACSGTCIFDDGHQTQGDTACHGKCTADCSGTCTGNCVVHANEGISCGASASCKGGCTGTFSQPKCETDFTPPTCTIDTRCFDSCRAKIAATVQCDPPTAKLVATAGFSADVDALVKTIDTNLGPLVASAEGQGKIVTDAVTQLVANGKVILNAAGSLDTHSLACATAAANAAANAASTLGVTVQASAQVSTTCSSHAQ